MLTGSVYVYRYTAICMCYICFITATGVNNCTPERVVDPLRKETPAASSKQQGLQ